ncbi:LysR family transcriptional regulator [Vibrio alfacsensis]|uniref:LysR family transcriptional regulator n=1 Tax=Vibrio alfacsensis TaxID=1074311 RepID=UPI001BEF893F|nr:LysR family transcriptional regulator [Vibrio alfacsensis]BCN26447.1 transcriptional regulator [Vibrio alfacsensis]
MNKLRLMSLFVHVVECGSISRAADKLELSKSVVSSALKQLEQELETCLLKRTTRKQTLTSAGERFYLQCAKMTKQAEMAWLEASEFKQVPAGLLTVTAPHALMRTIILPALTTAFSDFPDVHLNLISDDKHVDIVQQDIDVAVRVGASRDSNLKQRKVGQFCDLLCRARNLSSDLTSTPYIAQHWQTGPIHHLVSHGQDMVEVPFVVKHRSNTVFDVVSLLEMGMGVGVVPDFILKENSKLEAVPDAEPSKVNPIYILHPYHTHLPVAAKIAIEAIEKCIHDTMLCSVE